jgi:hypothetical protein
VPTRLQGEFYVPVSTVDLLEGELCARGRDADLDPSFHVNADPDLDPAPCQSDANLRPLVDRPSNVPL